MKHVKFNINSLQEVRIVFLLSLALLSFSAMASEKDVEYHDCDTTSVKDIFIEHEQMPQFPGGAAAMMKFLQEKVVYPPEAAKNKIQGRVIVQILIDSLGYVSEIKVARSVHPLLDEEAIRVVKMLPRFSPARFDGKAVSLWYTLPVTFTLNDSDEPAKPKDVEVKAAFPGGEAALVQFFKDHIKYPSKAAKKRIDGRVKVRFLVDKTGKVRDVKVLDSVDKDLEKEVVRVCRLLPDFIPASVNGEPVEVWFSLPIEFKIPGVKHQYIRTVQIDAR